jgi:epoxyqueuosine reductase
LLSDTSPLVRGAAVWALSRLLPDATFSALAEQMLKVETDNDVIAEWQAGLTQVEQSRTQS